MPLVTSTWVDPCMMIPFVSSGKVPREKFDPSQVDVVDGNSHLNSKELDKDNEKSMNNIVHSDVVGGDMEMVSNNETHGENYKDMQEVILRQEEEPMAIEPDQGSNDVSVLRQEEEPMAIEPDQGSNDAIVLADCRQGFDDSLSWLLGARERFLVTSERPNKKRKLLGADAGLEQLVLLPSLEGEAGSLCDVCCSGVSDMTSNRMLHCNICEVSVHQKCYGMHVVPNGYWLCSWCKSIRSARRFTRSDSIRAVSTPCVLCPKEGGALKPIKGEPGQTADGGNQKFVHLFCSLWTPEFLVEDMESMEPVTNTGDAQENRTKLICSLCKVVHGACVRCSYGTCRTFFHPMCARESKHQMEIWGKSGHNNVEMRAFCSKHSTVRRISSIDNHKATEKDSTESEPDDASLVNEKKQKLRATCDNEDTFMNNATTSCSSSTLNKVQTEFLTSPSTVRSVDSQLTESTDMVVDRPTGVENATRSFGDVPTILRKLIDQGKVSVGDIESELGLSESLEAALMPETTTFCPGLKLKITKLLQKSVLVSSAHQGTSAKNESKNLTDTHSELEEGICSFGHCFPDADNTNKDSTDSVQNGFDGCHDCEDDHMSGQHFVNIDGFHCYIHPSVGKRLQNLWGNILKQNEHAYHGELSCPHDQDIGGSSTELEQLADIRAADQIYKASLSDILEHSPNDELEGEMVYLQYRLLNEVVALKQRYEDLILNIVQRLSHELDSSNKRKWDHIIMNQYLRDIREAKKRGNTERRHKEAQAILAAAAPSVASTPPNVTVRQETENDVISAKQDSIPKVNAGSSRVIQFAILPQSKDSSISNSKISGDTDLFTFELAKFSKKNALPCDICMRRDSVLKRIFVCSSCKQAAVHLDCYQYQKDSAAPWECELCKEMLPEVIDSGSHADYNGAESHLAQCSFCHSTSGAFRKTTTGKWVHAFCAEWLLEGTFIRGQSQAVGGVEGLLKDKDTCFICLHNVGTCLKCCTVDCQVTFHPTCARDAGFYMNTKKIGSMLQHKAYCSKHGVEQRKTDWQNYGPDEVKSMKRMRVELERLRLICERIVKREKAKKDLVVCEYDVLAAKRDSTAVSMHTSYTSRPGASSESATTSVNNNSYSGIKQRSEDVTVDSTISRKHTGRFPLRNKETDRNTADSSTSTISYKQKLDDGESLTDKSLPERPVTALQKSEDGEKKSTDEKHRDASQKELVMTYDQAFLQNQCPLNRFVYTRRSSKKKQTNRGVIEGLGG